MAAHWRVEGFDERFVEGGEEQWTSDPQTKPLMEQALTGDVLLTAVGPARPAAPLGTAGQFLAALQVVPGGKLVSGTAPTVPLPLDGIPEDAVF